MPREAKLKSDRSKKGFLSFDRQEIMPKDSSSVNTQICEIFMVAELRKTIRGSGPNN